jgi:hypothetical protein
LGHSKQFPPPGLKDFGGAFKTIRIPILLRRKKPLWILGASPLVTQKREQRPEGLSGSIRIASTELAHPF